jgi:UDP-N-acetylmuramate: L-alanyl-gamma-D-glutamyl-meso-diaminopimelate ligase
LFTESEVRKVHLVGIGGTAMAALAGMLQDRGFLVTGSDEAVYPPMSDFLAQRGISVREGFGPQNLDEDVDLVVIGNALSRGNEEVEAILDRKMRFRSLPEVLRDWFIQGKDSLVVTGTHGKTTTSALLAWILLRAQRDPSYLVGGIPRGLAAGFRLGGGPEVVMEGDEYDTAFFDKRPKFLHYLPRIVTLGALEYDHADIYPSMEELMRAFRLLLRIIPRNGRLIVNISDQNAMHLSGEAPCPVITCGLDGDADWAAHDIRVEAGGMRFGVNHGGRDVGKCTSRLPGPHNVLNALLAVAAAHEVGVGPEISLPAISSFQGVRRRLEFLGEKGGVKLYDDFAHHPTAIRASLGALRDLYPRNRIWAIFEPRSNTMCRRIFQEALSRAFDAADRVVLGAVHRAERLAPEERMDPQAVVAAVRDTGRNGWYVPRVEDIVDLVADQAVEGDILCIMSNGGFGGIQRSLMDALPKRKG